MPWAEAQNWFAENDLEYVRTYPSFQSVFFPCWSKPSSLPGSTSTLSRRVTGTCCHTDSGMPDLVPYSPGVLRRSRVAAKNIMTSVPDYLVIETAFTVVQWLMVGPLTALAFART